MANYTYTNGAFRMTAIELIKAAMRQCRVIVAGGSLTAQETTDAMEALNILLKSYSTKGLKLWSHKEFTLTPVASVGTYTFGDSTYSMPESAIDVVAVNVKSLTSPYTEFGLEKYSRQEWRDIPTKAQTGDPSCFYFDPNVNVRSDATANYHGAVVVWPVPNAAFVAASTLQLHYVEPIADITLSTDYIEIPASWYRAIKWNLALEMAPEFDVPAETYNRIAGMAAMTLTEAEGSDSEMGTSVYFGVDR